MYFLDFIVVCVFGVVAGWKFPARIFFSINTSTIISNKNRKRKETR